MTAVEQNGTMTFIDANTLEIQSTEKNVANDKRILVTEVLSWGDFGPDHSIIS